MNLDPREAHLDRLRKVLAEGLSQADRGLLVDGPEAVAQVRESLRKLREPTTEDP